MLQIVNFLVVMTRAEKGEMVSWLCDKNREDEGICEVELLMKMTELGARG